MRQATDRCAPIDKLHWPRLKERCPNSEDGRTKTLRAKSSSTFLCLRCLKPSPARHKNFAADQLLCLCKTPSRTLVVCGMSGEAWPRRWPRSRWMRTTHELYWMQRPQQPRSQWTRINHRCTQTVPITSHHGDAHENRVKRDAKVEAGHKRWSEVLQICSNLQSFSNIRNTTPTTRNTART